MIRREKEMHLLEAVKHTSLLIHTNGDCMPFYSSYPVIQSWKK